MPGVPPSAGSGFLKRLSLRRSKFGSKASKASKNSSDGAEDIQEHPSSSSITVAELDGGPQAELPTTPNSHSSANALAPMRGLPSVDISNGDGAVASRELYRLFSEMDNILDPLRDLHERVMKDPDMRFSHAVRELNYLNIGAINIILQMVEHLERETDLPGGPQRWLLRARYIIRDYKSMETGFASAMFPCVMRSYERLVPPTVEERGRSKFHADLIPHLRSTLSPTDWPQVQALEYQYQAMRNAQKRADLLDAFLNRVLDVENRQSPAVTPSTTTLELVIAQNGDLVIDMASTPSARFRVSSQVLTQASPFFDYVLNPYHPGELSTRGPPPPDLEANIPRKKPVRMSDTSLTVMHLTMHPDMTIQSFTTFLYAAHLRNDKVPRNIEFQEFVDIAVTCHVYKCTAPVEMWVELVWLPSWRDHVAGKGYEDFLFISYVFGLHSLFEIYSKSLVLKLRGKNWPEPSRKLPQEVWRVFRDMRARKLKEILDCCRDTMHTYLPPPGSRPVSLAQDDSAGGIVELKNADALRLQRPTRCVQGSHECDATNLGILMMVMNEVGILLAVLDEKKEEHFTYWEINSLSQILSKLCAAPSAASPQICSRACDYAPSFRNQMCAIYNSVKGPTVRETNARFANRHALDATAVGGPAADEPRRFSGPRLGRRLGQSASFAGVEANQSNESRVNAAAGFLASLQADLPQTVQSNQRLLRSASSPSSPNTNTNDSDDDDDDDENEANDRDETSTRDQPEHDEPQSGQREYHHRHSASALSQQNLASLNASTHSITSTEVDIRTDRAVSPSLTNGSANTISGPTVVTSFIPTSHPSTTGYPSTRSNTGVSTISNNTNATASNTIASTTNTIPRSPIITPAHNAGPNQTPDPEHGSGSGANSGSISGSRDTNKIYWSPKADKEIITREDKELIISRKHLVSIGEDRGFPSRPRRPDLLLSGGGNNNSGGSGSGSGLATTTATTTTTATAPAPAAATATAPTTAMAAGSGSNGTSAPSSPPLPSPQHHHHHPHHPPIATASYENRI
ncbi:MAG: hypothetical protein M1825_001950 [Sarcosagium campestre]|nr:MAG: hypothetical protein M1825_001950 [Sarcosagium campestre]